MKKIILAPDSFKGTMSSLTVCNIMFAAIRKYFPEADVVKIPVADGGEGTVDCFLEAVGGYKVTVRVKGPYFEEMDSFYGILSDGNTAVMEMAAAAGLPLVENNLNPLLTTTYGVGQLIRHAVENGCTKVIIGLGGSCTNDGGAGMAAALGVRFLDEANNEFVPTGGTLDRIAKIDITGRMASLDGCSIVAACDVDNPLYGVNGAAYVFAPQKGADAAMVEVLDRNLHHLAGILLKDLGLDLVNVPGAGAAGGLGAGVIAFATAELKPGIEIVLDTVKFPELLSGASLVLTGEGKIDRQSLRGKVVIGVARQAKVQKVPVIAVVGSIGDDIEAVYSEGVTAVLGITREPIPFEIAKAKSESNLALTVETLMRILQMKIHGRIR